MKTRVSLGLAGLGVTVLRKSGAATDLLLTSGSRLAEWLREHGHGTPQDHAHKVTLVVPKRHFGGAAGLQWKEKEDSLIFDVQRRDLRIVGAPSGRVDETRGLRKPIGGGKRQAVPDSISDWRDVTWAVDFDHVESTSLVDKCFTQDPPEEVAARVHLTGGHLESGVPRHFCLRKERWQVLNSKGVENDLQVVADTMYHVWETSASEVVMQVNGFDGKAHGTVTLVAAGGVISGVLVQSRPVRDSDDQKCGEGKMEHHPHLYGVLKAPPGSVAIVQSGGPMEDPGFRVDENKRCGRGLISE